MPPLEVIHSSHTATKNAKAYTLPTKCLSHAIRSSDAPAQQRAYQVGPCPLWRAGLVAPSLLAALASLSALLWVAQTIVVTGPAVTARAALAVVASQA